MKQAVQSLFTAIQRSRTSQARAGIQGAQAQAPMTELSAEELRLVAGGDGNPGPHGSWGSKGTGA